MAKRNPVATIQAMAAGVAAKAVEATTADMVGEFINIPAWNTSGQIIDQRPAMLGSDDAIEVLLQQHPDDKRPRWYRLEPGQFRVQ